MCVISKQLAKDLKPYLEARGHNTYETSYIEAGGFCGDQLYIKFPNSWIKLSLPENFFYTYDNGKITWGDSIVRWLKKKNEICNDKN